MVYLSIAAISGGEKEQRYVVMRITTQSGIVHNIFLKNQADEHKVMFDGAGLTHSYDPVHKKIEVKGTGTITSGANIIAIADRVSVNNAPLKENVKNYILDEKGDLSEGFYPRL